MYTIKDRVCASRTDTNGIMKLTGAMDILQDCSLLWMESEPSVQKFFKDNNLGMFLISRQVDILRLPVYGENITVETRIFGCKSSYGYRNTVLYGENNQPCLLTWSVGAFVDLDTGRMSRLPGEEIDRLTIDEKIDMEYLDRKIVLPDLPGTRMEHVSVKRNDIDLYNHMNNAKYIETALEFLPYEFKVNRMRIEYRIPAKFGDRLYPKVIETPSGSWYILLLNARDVPFTTMEIA